MRSTLFILLASTAFFSAAHAETMHDCAGIPAPANVYLAPYSQLNNRIAQTNLARQGYYKGPVDGNFGAESRKALEGLQVNAGIEQDGVDWPVTVQNLGATTVPRKSCARHSANNRHRDR